MLGRNQRKGALAISAFLIAVAGFLLSSIACVAPRENDPIGGSAEPPLINRYYLKKKERKHGVPPESEWNRLGIWRKISISPAIYVPQGFSGKIPTSNSHGTWFDDERDGKRLFVPHEQVGEFSPTLLIGDAKKVTTWTYE